VPRLVSQIVQPAAALVGGDRPFLLLPCKTSSVVVCPGLGPQALDLGVGIKEGHEGDQRAGAPLL